MRIDIRVRRDMFRPVRIAVFQAVDDGMKLEL